MGWGTRVVVVLVLFVIGVAAMVTIAMRQKIDMLDDNYYEKEMKYQNVINAQKNVSLLNDSVLVTVNNGMVEIKLPQLASQNVSNGSIEFLRPSDKTQDKTITLNTNNEGKQVLPLNEFVKGLYHIRASWESNGKTFFDERNVILK